MIWLEALLASAYVTCNTSIEGLCVMADGAKRVQKHRDKMRAAGLKPVTIWVPDVNAPGFKEQIARDIAIINADADSHLVMEQMLSVADFSDWV
jgi:AmiR/NasT family two-component response regulator